MHVRHAIRLNLLWAVWDDILHFTNPLMGQYIFEIYPFLGVKLEDISDEIFERVGKWIAEFIAAF